MEMVVAVLRLTDRPGFGPELAATVPEFRITYV